LFHFFCICLFFSILLILRISYGLVSISLSSLSCLPRPLPWHWSPEAWLSIVSSPLMNPCLFHRRPLL
jgi:hypothetical protein